MTLTYDFNNEEYEFEADLEDYLDSLSERDICQLGREIYEKYTLEMKKSMVDDFGEKVLQFKPFNEESVELARSIIEDYDEDKLLDIIGEDMSQFFYKRAKEEYSDWKDYESNPWRYFGVSEGDFY